MEVICRGLISEKEIRDVRGRYLKEAEAARGIPELVDLSQADFSLITPASLQQLAEQAERAYKSHDLENVKIAFYTTDYLSSVMISLYGDFVGNSIQEVRIFNDKEKAAEWLCSGKPEMSYTIDLQKSIVFSSYSGYLRAEELINHIKNIRKDADFHGGLNTIADIRTALLPESYAEIMSLVNFIKSSLDKRGKFKLALIIEPTTTSRTAIIYEALAAEDHVRLCQNLAEAEDWLNQ